MLKRPTSSSRAQAHHCGSALGGYRTLLAIGLFQFLLLCGMSVCFQMLAMHGVDHNGGHDLMRMGPADPPSGGTRGVAPTAEGGERTAPGEQTADAGASDRDERPVVAYAVTITGCGESKHYSKADASNLITQGAVVLRHSIKLAHESSRYGFEMYAFVHPSARECSASLNKVGYKSLIRNTPFEGDDIKGKFLREHVDGASCCGRKEYIKLYAYTLSSHPVAVVLDLDSLVLRPLDGLFDAILAGDGVDRAEVARTVPVHDRGAFVGDKARIDAFFTKDYNMINQGHEKYAGVQGGFLVLRPSEAAFEEYVDIVLEGDYREGRGWGGKYGYFFGGAQIQGICSYFYGERHPENGVELNRCRINSLVDNPYFKDGKAAGQCRDGRASCEDCRSTRKDDVLSTHMTLCQKPWKCTRHWDSASSRLCADLHSEWFRIRRDFEETREDVEMRTLPPTAGGVRRIGKVDHRGYCGNQGYIPIKV